MMLTDDSTLYTDLRMTPQQIYDQAKSWFKFALFHLHRSEYARVPSLYAVQAIIVLKDVLV